MLTNFSIENIDGNVLPYAVVPVQGRPYGVEVGELHGKVGVIRADSRTHAAALAAAISMLGVIPLDIDCIIFEEYVNDEDEAPRWLIDKTRREGFHEMHPDAVGIYDMSGEHLSLVPASAFSLVHDDESGRGPLRVRFSGSLGEIACSRERALMIEDNVLDMHKIELVRHILTDVIAVRDDLSRERAKQIFDCLLIGRVPFPLSTEEVDEAFHVSGVPFIDVFRDISLSDESRQSKLDEIKRADELAEAAVVLWDWSLRSFGVPFTIDDWKALREKGRCWNFQSMCAMAELIGFDMMLDALIDGVPLSDLIA